VTDYVPSDRELAEIQFGKRVQKPIRKGKKVKAVPRKEATEWGWRVGKKEICDTHTEKGRAEYRRRTLQMATDQEWVCGCGCNRYMSLIPGPDFVTFGHTRGRGAGKRDDRIVDEFGNPMNRAERWDCNGRQGSPKREAL
jgi:hypothetical protein